MLSEQARFSNNCSQLLFYTKKDSESNELSGYIYHESADGLWRFDSVPELMELCEEIFDGLNYPQHTHSLRKLNEKSTPVLKKGLKDMTEHKDEIIKNNEPTFLIKVKYRQNASWQGTIKWLETDVERNFRSTLELIKLMDEAVGDGEEVEW